MKTINCDVKDALEPPLNNNEPINILRFSSDYGKQLDYTNIFIFI